MSRLTDLLAQARAYDPRMAQELEREIRHATNQRTFGLVFERRLPDGVELPTRPVRRGDTVHILPPRGTVAPTDPTLWKVVQIDRKADGGATSTVLEAEPGQGNEPELRDAVKVDDLVVVAQHDDTIYPGLIQTGEVVNSSDPEAPFHTVINAENLHALNLLTYTHRHKVGCIYIDPPYNTRDKDWKYNNDYVDGDDQYKHSKWLSMMEKRLELAKELLNPEDSVLIVTIDEKEYLRLGMLLEQTFPEARIQMVSSLINPTGAIRSNQFTRTDEYIYVVQFGSSKIEPLVLKVDSSEKVRWNSLRRFEMTSKRGSRPDQFYAIYVSESDGRIVGTSAPLADDVPRESVLAPDGCVSVFRVKPDGTEMIWGLTPPSLMKRVEKGFAKAVGSKSKGFTPYYLTSGKLQDIERGEIEIIGRNGDGSVEVRRSKGLKTVMEGVRKFVCEALI